MTQNTINLIPSLIAHRGASDHFPENSLEGVFAALEAGAHAIEIDVHITKDDVVILSHDATLKKITGFDLAIADMNYLEIKDLPASYKTRFKDQFSDVRIATLQQFCDLVANYPSVTFFIEIKKACVETHGHHALDLVLSIIDKMKQQVVLISFDHELLQYARTVCDLRIGWVMPEDSTVEKQNELIVEKLLPNYLFCDIQYVPIKTSSLWQGDWLLVAYTVTTIQQIKDLKAIGFHLFETNNIVEHMRQIRT